MKNFLCLLAFILITSATTSFAQQRATKYIAVKAENTAKVLHKNNLTVLDVRTPEEVAQGHLPKAINLDFKCPRFKEVLSALPKNKPYFVYCRSGNRSGKTVEMMKAMGFRKVYELEGGFLAYDAYQKNIE